MKDFIFICGEGNGSGFYLHKNIVSAVRRADFISVMMSYTVLKRSWCSIIVLKVNDPCEDKRKNVKNSCS
jgi:hypothetical protein